MIYLDYSATTPADSRVIDAFVQATKTFGNYNSAHQIGHLAKQQIDKATLNIKKALTAKEFDVIYTSGASESNNLAIKGYCAQVQSGRIITTRFEHTSIMSCLSELQRADFHVDFVHVTPDGAIDLEHLQSLIKPDTILLSFALVSSELGYAQSLESLHNVLSKHPHVKVHVDATQAVGKLYFDPNFADMVSISAHKIYGLKGIGLLLKHKDIKLTKQIHGGRSVSADRSGTPSGELIVSFAKAIQIALEEGNDRIAHITELRTYLEHRLPEIKDLCLNNPGSVPHIVNLSLIHRKGSYTQQELNKHGICVSVGSACSGGVHSPAVQTFTGSKEKASSSFRISLSHLTTIEEIDALLFALTQWSNQ